MPVARTRTEVNEQGVEVQVPYVEDVAQNYVAKVPYEEQVERAVKIPAKNSQLGTAIFSGFGIKEPARKKVAIQRPIAISIEDQQARSQKLSTEDWDTYVERLVNQGLVNSSQLQDWKAGRDVDLSSRKDFKLVRLETRTRQVRIKRKRSEQKTEKVLQQYSVVVPYSEAHDISFTLPGRGKQAADATNGGFRRVESTNQPAKSAK